MRLYHSSVDIEDTAEKAEDQTCIAAGTKNNRCLD